MDPPRHHSLVFFYSAVYVAFGVLCGGREIAPADGRSTWCFNNGHLRSKSPSMLAAPCPSTVTVDNSRAPPRQHIRTVGFGYKPSSAIRASRVGTIVDQS
eukprot:scaffold23830_cov102-Cyclotella_meneghiniana.AAC.5